MDAKPAPPVRALALLVAVCVTVIAAGVTWPAWDMFGAARRPMLQGWDDSFYYFWLPSVVIDHDVDFANQLAQSGTIDPATRDLALTLPRTQTGLLESKYPPGWALGSLPFFLLAHGMAPEDATGFEPVYLCAVWLGQLLYAVVGLWLAVQILARYFPPSIAWLAALTGWLTSPLVYYQTARLSMSHSQVFTLAMAVFWIALRIREGDTRPRLWLMLGLFSTLMVVTRNVTLVYLILPAIVVLQKVRSLPPVLWLIAGAAGPAVVQIVAWKLLYGSWIAYSYGGERFDFRQLHVWQVLFSPLHGWLYWHPFTLVGVGAFMPWAWSRPEGRAWLISLTIIIVLSSAWPTWWLGSSFGYRGFEVATFFVMIGLAVLLKASFEHRLARRILSTAITIAIVWNLGLFALFLTQRIPREAPVTHRQALQAFQTWIIGR